MDGTNVPPGWRFLEPGETVMPGDKCAFENFLDRKWYEVSSYINKVVPPREDVLGEYNVWFIRQTQVTEKEWLNGWD